MGRRKKVQENEPLQEGTNPHPEVDRSAMELLRGKLRHKYALLAHEPLEADTLDQLKSKVCTIMGIDMPQLDWLLQDL
jgi:hypothetical protein